MRISHKNHFVFLAYPRTASTSIRRALDPHSDVRGVNVTRTRRDSPFYHHITARELKAVFDERGWNWTDYRSFCVVRNPYSRVVSLYHHHLRMRVGKHRELNPIMRLRKRLRYKLKPEPTFRDYVQSLAQRPGLARPFKEFAFDSAGNCLVGDVLRFEKLATELPAHLLTLGLGQDAWQIPVLATSNIRDYREPYDEDTVKTVAALYAFEIERYGYCFDAA